MGGRMAAVVGVVALLAGGLFALTALGDDGNGPEDPVRDFLEAAAAGDVIGMLEQLAPGERDAVREPLEDLVDELERLGVLDDVDLADLDAYDLDLSGLELESELVTDDMAHVQIRAGTVDYALDPSRLPLGPLVEDLLDGMGIRLGAMLAGAGASGTDEIGSDGPIEDGIVTIRRDGRWYISLGYTIAEQARREAGVPVDALPAGVSPDGAATPEEAVEELVAAVAGLDLRRVIALLPPGEMGALQRYAGLFLSAFDDVVRELPGDLDITVDGLDVSPDADGDRATVKVDDIALTVVADGATYRVADGCVTFTQPGRAPERACAGDTGSLGGFFGLPGFGTSGDLDVARPATGELPDVGITVVRVDGEWFVSPIRTALDAVVASLAELDRDDVEDAIQQLFLSLSGLAGRTSGGGSECRLLRPTGPGSAC
jgi:hypothetical protein